MKKPKPIKKLNYRRLSNKVKKEGGLKKATYAQIEHIYKVLTLKYVMSLEDQLQEDKAHLLLKQETIENLQEDIRQKNNVIRRWQLHGYKSAKEVNKVLEDYKEANKDLSKQNKEVIKNNYELTRAYNGLHTLGKFAVESGVDIKKYNGQLPENNKWNFEQKHTLTESGKVKHQYRLKPKKENK